MKELAITARQAIALQYPCQRAEDTTNPVLWCDERAERRGWVLRSILSLNR